MNVMQRETERGSVTRAYRDLGPTGPLPALRVETAFQACATEEQLFRRVMGDLSSAEMVISVLKSRIKQSLLSAPKPAVFRVGMKLRCPGSIENGQASVRGAVVTHVEVRQNSVRVTSTDIPLNSELTVVDVKPERLMIEHSSERGYFGGAIIFEPKTTAYSFFVNVTKDNFFVSRGPCAEE